jgi:predicted ATPase with chaperone activity
VARTIADLDGSAVCVGRAHLAEALQLRRIDA